jgi:hypothetical protein
MPVPAGRDKDRAPSHIEPVERLGVDSKTGFEGLPDDEGGKVREGFHADFAQVLAVCEPMRRHVDVSAGVGDHVDPPDLEGRAIVVIGRRLLARNEVANVRTWQTLVGHHALGDDVAQVDEPRRCVIFHKATNPIPIQMMLSAVEGSAPCHHPLMVKPAAPTTFMP